METSSKSGGIQNVIIGIVAIVVLFICAVGMGILSGVPTGVDVLNKSATATAATNDFFANPQNALSIANLETNVPLRGCDYEVCGTDFSTHQITNVSGIVVSIDCEPPSGFGGCSCDIEYPRGVATLLDPGESIIIYCEHIVEFVPPDTTCIQVYNERSYAEKVGEWCYNGETQSFEFYEN